MAERVADDFAHIAARAKELAAEREAALKRVPTMGDTCRHCSVGSLTYRSGKLVCDRCSLDPDGERHERP
jgi:hypothetical protein